MVIEDMGDMAMELMCKLLRALDESVIVTPEQMKRVSELPLHCFCLGMQHDAYDWCY